MLKEQVAETLAKALELNEPMVLELLEVPPDEHLGDYALPCFSFAKAEKKSPVEIAKAFASRLERGLIKEARAVGPYLNLFLDQERVMREIITNVLEEAEEYGADKKQQEKVMIEYSQPNTHKAFHVGHLRGTSIGEALARILRHRGYEVVQANYSGDTGMHVAKWLWCYQHYHAGEEAPEEPGERARWLASIYVEAVKRLEKEPEAELAVRELNRTLDEGKDEKLMKLWQRTRQWSIEAFERIYEELGAHFDVWWFEREFEARGKELSKELVERGIAKKSDGAIIVDLEERGLGVWVLLRNDGTPLYSAKDLALAEKKFKEYDITRSIYVVGQAQALHLRQLFTTLELMGFPHAEKCFHLGFEEVRLPTGKMSSRTGQNILYEDLRDEVFSYTEAEVRKRHEQWSDEQVARVVKAVAVCALKFEMLYRDHNKPIVFETSKVCSFEGDTGPYLQYTHARCNSILKRLKKNPEVSAEVTGASFKNLGLPEYRVVKELERFPTVLQEVATSHYPEHLAKYALELAKRFNSFYHECKVIGDPAEQERALLVSATRQVLRLSLTLLGIEAPDEM